MKYKSSIVTYLLLSGALFLVSCSTERLQATVEATATNTFMPPTSTPIPFTATPRPTDTPVPTPTLGVGSTKIGQDGANLVYVPAGEFLMGSVTSDSFAQKDEFPQHAVYLDAFWIDQTEVTNKQYSMCVDAGVCSAPPKTGSDKRNDYFGNPEFENYPVVHMTWDAAQVYCNWAGRGLPTEAQWEKAARGTDARLYPWGNDDPNAELLNFNNNVGETTEVGSYELGKSPYGAYDMVGNVWEWVRDRYSQVYYSKSPTENPTGPESGQTYVLRGGGYDVERYTWIRAAERSQGTPPQWYYVYIGFRCALSTP